MAKLTAKQIQEKRDHHNAVVKAWRKKNWEKFQAYEKKYRAEKAKQSKKKGSGK
jgi:hypothetical protein